MTAVKKTLSQLDTCSRDISNQQAATANSMHTTFSCLREVLEVRETELISQLDLMAKEKLKNLTI